MISSDLSCSTSKGIPTYYWLTTTRDIKRLSNCLPSLLRVSSAMKSIFSRHGIPDELQSDNGPQFDSMHSSSLPSPTTFTILPAPHAYYPQGNALAERTVKSLLEKAKDPHFALLNYRATPFPWCGLSPVQLLLGRELRSSLPHTKFTSVNIVCGTPRSYWVETPAGTVRRNQRHLVPDTSASKAVLMPALYCQSNHIPYLEESYHD